MKEKQAEKSLEAGVSVIGLLEIVGYSTIDKLLWLRNSAEKYNKVSKDYVYAVIRNPRGKKHGYYLIRESVK